MKVAGFMAGLLASATVGAQQPPVPLKAELIRGGVYLVRGGSGANTAFIVGKREVVVVDAKMTEESAKAMLAEIQKIAARPVKRVVLTHSDGDHVNGLAGFPAGLSIIAHENTKKDMEQAFQDPKWSALRSYLPNEVLTGDRELDVEGVKIRLLYFGRAHTSGDLVVYVPEHKIAFLGDLAFVGRDPLIHRHKGGNSFGLAAVLKKVLALEADTFLAGHTDPLSRADLEKLVASIEEKQAKVKALVAQGKSLDEIKQALGAADLGGQKGARRPGFIEVIYQELTQGQ